MDAGWARSRTRPRPRPDGAGGGGSALDYAKSGDVRRLLECLREPEAVSGLDPHERDAVSAGSLSLALALALAKPGRHSAGLATGRRRL